MKEKVIVPGIHDHVPPQGRVTVQLLNPDTDKVVHEVKAENAIMDWFLSQVTMSRGDFYDDVRRQLTPNLSPISALIASVEQRSIPTVVMNKPGIYPGWYAAGPEMNFIWGSSSNITPDSTHTVMPGSDTEGMMTGFARLDVAHTPDAANLPRGTVVSGSCRHTWAQTRMVVEFTTAQGNGVYRSIGTGSISQRSTIAGGGGAAHPASLWYPQNIRPANGETNRNITFFRNGGNNTITGAAWPDHRMFLVEGDVTGATSAIFMYNWHTTGLTAVSGPTSTTIGGTGRISVCTHGGNLWVGRGTSLKRCDYPTNTTLNVLNTYSPVTGFTDAAIIDITSDGTNIYALGSTKVFVINPATGAVTSSWTHSLPRAFGTIGNIEWDPAMQMLWLTSETHVSTGYYPWGLPNTTNASNLSNSPLHRSYGYTTAGVRLNYAVPPTSGGVPINVIDQTQQANSWDGNSISRMESGITGMAQQNGWTSVVGSIHSSGTSGTGFHQAHFRGPAMSSHALLPSDVTKTSSNTLRIIYDFDYTDV